MSKKYYNDARPFSHHEIKDMQLAEIASQLPMLAATLQDSDPDVIEDIYNEVKNWHGDITDLGYWAKN